jgi:hypothetical protein
MSYELTPQDKVLAYLPIWQEYKDRHYRTPGDSKLKLSWEAISDHMDTLIEVLMAGIIVVTPVEEYERNLINPIYDPEMGMNIENYGLANE